MLPTVDDAAMLHTVDVAYCGWGCCLLWSAADDLDDAGCCVCCVGMLCDAMGRFRVSACSEAAQGHALSSLRVCSDFPLGFM